MQVTQITLQASPSIAGNILEYLNSFSKNDVKIVAKQEVAFDAPLDVKERLDISQMGGILAQYTDRPISDDEIQDAITQGMMGRAYPK
ncbi:hypothetical protein B0181_10880 [Moraxella caviae]|uniref:Uncharacterized protein n=2 Tax=Moraxella caviae TaxID=34060 RepID=A0A1S9ZUN3_9GAMM|nr:hypothetical protein [Moraxella caviae]OOR87216.1 hypothetical protein B0181_10880 [Moraxella caviae]STZ09921.1 Uncharacterised protein [Moraxella caviae]